MVASCTRAALCVFLLVFVAAASVQAQSDKEIKTKQQQLKQIHTENQEKNQTVNNAAKDKPEPSLSAFGDAENKTTGYDFTQVKGYQLTSKADFDRIDELFKQANELGFIDKEYTKNGAFAVPGSSKPGTAQIRRVEVYFVRTSRMEREELNAADFEILEVRVEKQLNLPEKEESEDTDEEESGGRRRRSRTKTVVNAFKLAGSELITCIGLVDDALRQDLLTRRTVETPISLPADLATDYARKRGPFVVQGDRALDVMKGVFRTFWNTNDSLTAVLVPQVAAAAGPLSEIDVPLLLPQNKITLRNQTRDPLKITSASFVGENADQFAVSTKLPLMIEPNKAQDIEVKFTGESKYEVMGTVEVNAKEAQMTQEFDVYANAGMHPVDFAVLDASLFGVELRSPAKSSFAPNWNLGFRFGNDEINLPRWSSGMGSLYVGYKNDVHVGLIMPVHFYDPSTPEPLTFNTNLLSSPMGYTFDFDFSFGFPFSLGGNVTILNKFEGADGYSHLKVLKNVKVDDLDYTNDFFNVSTVGKMYYPLMFKDRENDPNMAFRFELGGGFLQVNRNHLVAPGETSKEGHSFTKADVGKMFYLAKEKDIFDVYFRVSFINLGSKHNYGLGLQYFNGGVMTDAWLELTHWLRVELKYSVLLRSREVWESESTYFMVSPRFRFGFPSIFH